MRLEFFCFGRQEMVFPHDPISNFYVGPEERDKPIEGDVGTLIPVYAAYIGLGTYLGDGYPRNK